MSSDDDGDDVKLYNPLERNRKRQQFVSFSSSESDGDDDNSLLDESPLVRKRRRWSVRQSTSPGAGVTPIVTAIDDDDDGDDDDVERLMTPSEREAARRAELQIEMEIAQRIQQDALLSQTRAIMYKTSSTQRQLWQETDAARREVIALDSDDDDTDPVVQLLPSSTNTSQHSDKGERIELSVRSNGERTDLVPIHMREPFDVLYKNFCDLLGLPRAAVAMSLDGAPLAVTATPQSCDLEALDIIDARVDFAQQRLSARKTFVRLRLVVAGKRPEIFKIDATQTIEKLRASFCTKHAIAFDDDVALSALGVDLELTKTIDAYGLRDNDEIAVAVARFIDPSAIGVQLRFADGAVETHSIVPTDTVATLLQTLARERHTQEHKVSLRLDGETMAPSQSFEHYDLQGEDLIEVKIAS